MVGVEMISPALERDLLLGIAERSAPGPCCVDAPLLRRGKHERRTSQSPPEASPLDQLVFFSLIAAVFLVVLSVSYLDEDASSRSGSSTTSFTAMGFAGTSTSAFKCSRTRSGFWR